MHNRKNKRNTRTLIIAGLFCICSFLLVFIIKNSGQYSNDAEFVQETLDVIQNPASKDASGISDEELIEVSLKRVIDGDTLLIEKDGNEVRVRLIGINTPESVAPDESRNTIYGEMASDNTKNILKDTETLYLQYDEKLQDKYGRDLAYVWLKNDVDTNSEEDIENYMLNAILVKTGYAEQITYLPNNKYETLLKKLYDTAREKQLGLFSYDDFTDFE